MRFQEVVHKLNHPDEAYWCELLHREAGYVVLKYHVSSSYARAARSISQTRW